MELPSRSATGGTTSNHTDTHPDQPSSHDQTLTLQQRVERLETELEALQTILAESITTRRLAIVDGHGERITLCVTDIDDAEIAVMSSAADRDTAVSLSATPGPDGGQRGLYIEDGQDTVVSLEIDGDERPSFNL